MVFSRSSRLIAVIAVANLVRSAISFNAPAKPYASIVLLDRLIPSSAAACAALGAGFKNASKTRLSDVVASSIFMPFLVAVVNVAAHSSIGMLSIPAVEIN